MTAANGDIRHDPATHRFTVDVDGHRGYVEYTDADAAIAITHTVVPEAIGGRGIAGRLMQAALEYARSAGLKVIPRCSYAQGYFDKHPEQADLLA